ncbi:MAG: glycosyltransferase family 39 protein [Nitrospirae bacterium]|nr:glycosyltransferase family 39 protein [Nitrospirota bacterium]MBF0534545.1 glycosyltransferase family 39 protein [Nitrospirota bacterium]MBF0617580.1 glycosyltransferase family 39 protein [Nitrospirota bacterium]
MFKKITIICSYVLLAVSALFLLLYALNDRPLWGDEAETALLSANIVKFGVPKVFDGKNLIALFNPTIEANQNGVWIWRPWLGEYLAALSFAFLGESTFAARFPFALFGLMTLTLLAYTAFYIYKSHKAAVLSVFFLLASELFALHVRQCRYYSVVMFTEVWIILSLFKVLKGNKKSAPIQLAIALALQFYSNYIVVLGNVIALVVLTCLFYKKIPTLLRNFAVTALTFTAFVLPWIFYAKLWQQGAFLVDHEDIPFKILYYIAEIHFHLFPVPLLLIIPIYLLTRQVKKTDPPLSTLYAFICILIPVTMLTVARAPGIYLRYNAALFPVFALIAAVITGELIKNNLISVTLAILLGFTNLLSVYTIYPIKSMFEGFQHTGVHFKIHTPEMPVLKMLRSITTHYENKLTAVATFINRESKGKDGSIYVADPEFPLIFYTNVEIIDARFFPPNISNFKTKYLPDWILPVSASGIIKTSIGNIPDAFNSFYEKLSIEVYDSKAGGSAPEPDSYEYFTAEHKSSFIIYKKRNLSVDYSLSISLPFLKQAPCYTAIDNSLG